MPIDDVRWQNCSKCNHRFAEYMKNCPRCGAASSERAKRMATKLIGISGAGIGAIIAIIFIMQSGVIGTVVSVGSDLTNAAGNTLESMSREDAEYTPFKFDNAEIATLVHEKVNTERANSGLRSLAWDSELATIAEGHSQDMAERDFFSHDTPDGMDLDDRYRAAGHGCAFRGENIAKIPFGYADDEESIANKAVNAWMTSEGHRQNILFKSFSKEGIGLAYDGSSIMFTQNFC